MKMNVQLSKKTRSILAVALAMVILVGALVYFAPGAAAVAGISVQAEGYGISDDGASFAEGAMVAVKNTSRLTRNQATYTYDGSDWTTEDTLVWASDLNTFQAWYPANSTTSYSSFVLPSDQSAGWQDADWMTATTSQIKPADPSTTALDLTFTHNLTKITVAFKYNDEYDGSETVSSVAIAMPATQTVSGVTLSDSATTVTPYSDDSSLDGYECTAIIIPGTYEEGDTFMTIIIRDDTMNVKANAQMIAGLEAGKHYTFTVTVGKDAITVSGVTVKDWETTESLGKYEAEPVE